MQLVTFELCFHVFHSNEYNWAWLCFSSIIQTQPETWSNILNLQLGIILSVARFSTSVFLANSFNLVFFFFSHTVHNHTLQLKRPVPSLYLSHTYTCSAHSQFVTQKCTAGFDLVEFPGSEVIRESWECCITNNHQYCSCIMNDILFFFLTQAVPVRTIISQSTERTEFKNVATICQCLL